MSKMSNWPKNIVIEARGREGTFGCRMWPGYVTWRRYSAKRYAEAGAARALTTLSKRHSGMDFRIVAVTP